MYSAEIFIDDNLVSEYNSQELLEADGTIAFAIPASDSQQTIKLVAIDFAGNSTEDLSETEIVYSNVVVTTNAITILLNSSWFIIVILVLILLILIIIFIVVKRKNKKKKELADNNKQ